MFLHLENSTWMKHPNYGHEVCRSRCGEWLLRHLIASGCQLFFHPSVSIFYRWHCAFVPGLWLAFQRFLEHCASVHIPTVGWLPLTPVFDWILIITRGFACISSYWFSHCVHFFISSGLSLKEANRSYRLYNSCLFSTCWFSKFTGDLKRRYLIIDYYYPSTVV